MNNHKITRLAGTGIVSLLICYCGSLGAETVEQKMDRLELLIQSQQLQLEAQDRRLDEQARLLNNQGAQSATRDNSTEELPVSVTAETQQPNVSSSLVTAMDMDFTVHRRHTQKTPRRVNSSDIYLASAIDSYQEPIAIAGLGYMAESRGGASSSGVSSAPQVQAIPDIGGVLTAPGKLVFDTSLQYSHSSLNRFTFKGVEILSSFAIGLLEAEDADRDTTVASLTGRMGITSRLEAEVRVPYLWRSVEVEATIPGIEGGDGQPITTRENLDNTGLGDIEAALHYQLNRGGNGYPYFIGNLRYKSTSGDGPFDVDRDISGIETELAMGSGFHSIEPSITMLYPTDPAVIYANFGYLINLEDDVNAVIIDATDPAQIIKTGIGDVDPGDSFRFSLGMAYSVNERTSFSLGYKHDFIQKTSTDFFNPDTGTVLATTKSARLNIAGFLLGYTIQLPKNQSINFNFEFGATDDSPDVSFSVRMPFLFDL